MSWQLSLRRFKSQNISFKVLLSISSSGKSSSSLSSPSDLQRPASFSNTLSLEKKRKYDNFDKNNNFVAMPLRFNTQTVSLMCSMFYLLGTILVR